MKRSPSPSHSNTATSPSSTGPSSKENVDKKSHIAPNKKPKPTPPSTPKQTKSDPSSASPSNSHWTPDKREQFLDGSSR
ncbi:hypothetical protein I302_104072 [Kwoniella bestiolae CBS 10118]|uniref:Uncharacterized protein n=1 Tax=Kwoniella bestiolae CBS 10118 TaxID=1296100 RepID=A0A1B9GA87_9TREE|nr:hypothetical protein I302_02777 [Kwoniella bestiolae CBS 10118]OCF27927.1 hypothetical protein I302_02777 [Kwoniella bestiolae CBS 10118]